MSPRKQSVAVSVDSVVLSHPDKELFPEIHLTKAELAEYYHALSKSFLPGVKHRPLSLLCCPQGRKTCFVQKHLSFHGEKAPPSIKIKDKDGVLKEYSYVDDQQDVIQFIQLNVLEFHPWSSTIEDLLHPDLLIFDLDPGPGVREVDIIRGAKLIRLMLQEFKIRSFPRVTGGNGMHLVSKLKPQHTWDEVKAFAKRIALTLESEAPNQFIAHARKADRKNRVFVDYLRNSVGATAIANYSTRAREGAPVAVPLTWAELEGQKTLPVFSIKDTVKRVEKQKRDPWFDIDKTACRLPKLT